MTRPEPFCFKIFADSRRTGILSWIPRHTGISSRAGNPGSSGDPLPAPIRSHTLPPFATQTALDGPPVPRSANQAPP